MSQSAMALFQTSPDKQASDLDSARSNREKLARRLTEALATADKCRAAAQRLAVAVAPVGELDRAEATLRAGRDRFATLTAALAEGDTSIKTLEEQIADAADKKLRAESAAKLEKMAKSIEADARAFDLSVATLTKSASLASGIIFEAKGLELFCGQSRQQVPPAAQLIAKLLRARAVEVVRGFSPAHLRTAEPPAVKEIPPPPTTQIVHSTFEPLPVGKPFTLKVAGPVT